jgi:hypothetical protein
MKRLACLVLTAAFVASVASASSTTVSLPTAKPESVVDGR